MMNPWLKIPLTDYEGHMSLPSIAQAEMLAEELRLTLLKAQPESLAVIGCAGGNGFEHIDPLVTKRIVSIDINSGYIDMLKIRFSDKLPGLETYALDIQSREIPIPPVDLVFAALIFEYVDLEACFRNLCSLCQPRGHLISVIQLPSQGLPAVSQSPFSSLGALSSLMRFVSPEEIEGHATKVGFTSFSSRVIKLASGKEFQLQWFHLGA